MGLTAPLRLPPDSAARGTFPRPTGPAVPHGSHRPQRPRLSRWPSPPSTPATASSPLPQPGVTALTSGPLHGLFLLLKCCSSPPSALPLLYHRGSAGAGVWGAPEGVGAAGGEGGPRNGEHLHHHGRGQRGDSADQAKMTLALWGPPAQPAACRSVRRTRPCGHRQTLPQRARHRSRRHQTPQLGSDVGPRQPRGERRAASGPRPRGPGCKETALPPAGPQGQPLSPSRCLLGPPPATPAASKSVGPHLGTGRGHWAGGGPGGRRPSRTGPRSGPTRKRQGRPRTGRLWDGALGPSGMADGDPGSSSSTGTCLPQPDGPPRPPGAGLATPTAEGQRGQTDGTAGGASGPELEPHLLPSKSLGRCLWR